MKYMFASDLHGSARCTEKLLEKFEASGAENLILMGDLLYHGARNDLPGGYDTKAVTAMLNRYQTKIIACRGNCDSEVDQMVLNFPITSDYNILDLNGIRFFQTHGHIYGPDRMPPMGVCQALVFGHIHIPVAKNENGVYLLNPGSVSIPKGGYPGSYAILEERHFQILDFEDNCLKEIEIEQDI